MKKLTALLSAIALGLTSAPATAFAESATEPVAPEIQMGDVDGNGRIDVCDATLTLRYYTQIMSEADTADILYYDNIVKYGDINGDGIIDCCDASVMLRKYTEYASTTTDGDVNLDGVVDITDACLILNCYSSLIEEKDFADIPYYDNIVKYGDMNDDGIINATDASLVGYIYEAKTGEKIGFIDAEAYLKEKGII
jgi:hypothetical protein